jgi:hypothetical protein
MARLIRLVPVLAALASLSIATAALATDDPPGSAPPPTASTPTPGAPAGSTAPGTTAPGSPNASGCTDTTRPSSRVVTTSGQAKKTHKVSGTASDRGCTGSKVAHVSVSVARKSGSRCQFVSGARLSRATSCKSPRWLNAAGSSKWSLRLPKSMPRGTYQVLTRAVDSAGNVERAHARRLAIR